METMQKLNIMGKPIGEEQSNNNATQIVNVTYGHHGGGKLYSYLGKNKRAGDIVTPYVTNKKSGKTYKTLAVVRSTHQANQGQDTVDYLNNKNIKMKTIGKTDQTSLPGYYKGWDKDADAAYELKKETLADNSIPQMQKLSLLRDIIKMR